MAIFKETLDELTRFEDYTKLVDSIITDLNNTANASDINTLKKIKNNFIMKTKDFFNENRKLNIGVVGQVKAGKSSFLNAMLFNGKEILPKASTPKTATLTKMEHSEENIIQIEYYSVDEWEVLKDNAAVDLDDEIYTSAREIVEMTRRSGINPLQLLEKGTEQIKFERYEDLISQLNDYVGEDGKYTPLVKAVTLFLNKEEFKEISIVDTPGLNDPIASRTIRTKEFIEVCDVVFFLSQSGSFLDKSDWTLLSSQLPQKGVKKLVLIASKYDSGVRDILRPKDDDDIFGEDNNTADNIPKACKIIQKKLKRRAKEKVSEFIEDLRKRECSEELINVIEECNEPVLISSMAYNMSNKEVEEYNREEMNVYNALTQFSTDLESDLKLMGNVSKVQDIFDTVVNEKEEILLKKLQSFIPTAMEELKQLLGEFREKAEKRLKLLSCSDRKKLFEQKCQMVIQINSIKADLTTVFTEMKTKLETEKSKAIREMRNISKEYYSLNEHTGTITKTESYTAYSGSFLFFKWGKHTEYYTYEEHYSYLAAADAAENLRKFALDGVNGVESIFTEAIQIKEMKRKLLNVVINDFDMGSEKYDSSLFRIIVEKTINSIEYPVIKIDISDAVNQITAKFSGEITSAEQKQSLSGALANAISKILEEISDRISDSVKEFKTAMDKTSNDLQKLLLENITKEFEDILNKFENKEKEINGFKGYIDKLEDQIKKI